MPNSKFVIAGTTVEFHADDKYALDWALSQEMEPKSMPNGLAIVAAAPHSITQINVHGAVLSSQLIGQSADRYIWNTWLPALRLISTSQTADLTLEVGSGQIQATGWILNLIADRIAPKGEEIITFSFTFLLSQPADVSGLV